MLRRITTRHARCFGAAVIATAALLLAANAGPARAVADPAPAPVAAVTR
jgi:hypothetical protein